MLRHSDDLRKLAISATDGVIGDVKDLYFDDETWVIRYLVVETGSWLSSRKVLVTPIAAGPPDWDARELPVSLTRAQVKDSPDIDTDMPVTRQHEAAYLDYYSFPYYWMGADLWMGGDRPDMLLPGRAGDSACPAGVDDAVRARVGADTRAGDQDPHLRSCAAVEGYGIGAIDGDIGHVQGLLVDEDSWAIRYLVVGTGNVWLGHDVLVAPQWIRQVSWTERTVQVDLTREALKQAPAYDPDVPLSRALEIAVYEHYGRPGYWQGAGSVAGREADRHERA